MKKITLKAFLASELPDEVRQRVVDEHQWINVDCDWWEPIIDDFVSHMEEAYGAYLEKGKIEFDLDRGEYIKYNGVFGMDINACKDGTVKEINSSIATAALLSDDPELTQQVKEVIGNMGITYEGPHGGVSINLDSVDDDEKGGFQGPFEVLADILNDDSYTSLLDRLADELEALMKDEFRELLRRLQSEFQYLTSDECVVETLDANDYLFTENGERIPARSTTGNQ